jgi:thioredoxin 1
MARAYIGRSRGVNRRFWTRSTRKEISMSTVKVTDESFEKDVLQASGPVLVDFWAEWCGPCKQIAPALEQIADELSGNVTVAKLNIEESPTTPSRYGVRGIPTMMLFKGGQMASMKVGAMPKQKILEWLSEAGVAAAA